MRTNTGFVPFGVGTGYGLGVWITSTGCGEALGHGGSIEGFETRALTVADKGRSVVVMVNTADGSIADNVAEAALCG